MSAKDPLITIITPTYNRADFILQAVESVMGQTYGNFEFLIVDDGSTDNTVELLEPYLKDERVRLFQQENQGQSVARNRGIAEARGQFICFLDSDNAWVRTKLEISLKAFEEHPEVDIVYGDFITIDGEGHEHGVNRMARYSGRITPQLLRDNFVSMNTTMTRKRCFDEMGGFDSADRLAEDYGLWLRFSTRYQFLYVPVVLGYYRVMENQISSDKESRFRANEQLVQSFLKAFPSAVTRGEARRGLSYFFIRKGRYEYSSGQRRQAIRSLLRSLSKDPFWMGPWRFAVKMVLTFSRGRRM
ncbi:MULTISPECIES: glycosyltransferase [unclassified Marinobacter]|uniref:glycosyltransferase n=1 Tax=unclassified Marinobacter TaxID=83889 RepID=UPI0004BBB637|nr:MULTISPECIES: glycosyltransferase [unclassified Marinobacter]